MSRVRIQGSTDDFNNMAHNLDGDGAHTHRPSEALEGPTLPGLFSLSVLSLGVVYIRFRVSPWRTCLTVRCVLCRSLLWLFASMVCLCCRKESLLVLLLLLCADLKLAPPTAVMSVGKMIVV